MSATGPRLVTDRLLVVLPSPDMAARVAAYHEGNRAHHAPWSPPRAASFYAAPWWRERLRLARAEWEAGAALRLVLLPAGEPEGPVLGECNLNNVVRGAFQAGHIGYSIDRLHEGKGLMSEALRAVIRHAFDDLRLHRLMANYRPENVRSARLLLRLGFAAEGIARDYLFIDGAWRDHVLTSLVNPVHPGPEAR